MLRSGSRFSLIMMLIWERDSQRLAITKFMRRGTFSNGGINLTPMRLIFFQEAGRFQQVAVSSELSSRLSARYCVDALPKR